MSTQLWVMGRQERAAPVCSDGEHSRVTQQVTVPVMQARGAEFSLHIPQWKERTES